VLVESVVDDATCA